MDLFCPVPAEGSSPPRIVIGSLTFFRGMCHAVGASITADQLILYQGMIAPPTCVKWID